MRFRHDVRLLKESAIKLIRWPCYVIFFKLPWLSFWEEERQKRPETNNSRCCQPSILICPDFKGRAKEYVIASLPGNWDVSCLSGIIHLFDLGKEGSRNKLRMHFPKGSKDIIHTGSLPPVSASGV